VDVIALALVLTSAGLHAAWNLAAKRVADGARFVWAYHVVSTLAVLPVVVVSIATGPQRPSWIWLLTGAVTAVLHAAYGVVLQRGYQAGDLSVVYPVARGTGPLLSVAAAVVLLGERPAAVGLLGAVLVGAGVLVIGTARPSPDADRPVDRQGLRRGVGYGALTGVTIAGYTLWDAYAVTTLGVPPLAHVGIGAVVLTLLLSPYALHDRSGVERLWRAHRREVLIVGLLSPVAYLLVLYALRIAPVSLVAPARESGIVLAGFAAWIVLGEARPARRLTGSCVVFLGIVAIALA
jgi:drug/metabolite transporter (DMT)-like permease